MTKEQATEWRRQRESFAGIMIAAQYVIEDSVYNAEGKFYTVPKRWIETLKLRVEAEERINEDAANKLDI